MTVFYSLIFDKYYFTLYARSFNTVLDECMQSRLKIARDISGKNIGPSINEKWMALRCVLSKEGSAERPSVKVFEAQQPAPKRYRGKILQGVLRYDTPGAEEKTLPAFPGSRRVRHLISLSLTGRYFSVLRFLTLFYLYTRGKTLLPSRAIDIYIASSTRSQLAKSF